jgi:hypothetical protein
MAATLATTTTAPPPSALVPPKLGREIGETEAVTIRQGHGAYGYQIRALACFAVLTDNVLRRIEGTEETIFLWVRLGGWEVIFVFGVLSLVLQLLFWSEAVNLGDPRTHRR